MRLSEIQYLLLWCTDPGVWDTVFTFVVYRWGSLRYSIYFYGVQIQESEIQYLLLWCTVSGVWDTVFTFMLYRYGSLRYSIYFCGVQIGEPTEPDLSSVFVECSMSRSKKQPKYDKMKFSFVKLLSFSCCKVHCNAQNLITLFWETVEDPEFLLGRRRILFF